MKAKPIFKERKIWLTDVAHSIWANARVGAAAKTRLRLSDSRRPSALRVAERILQALENHAKWHPLAFNTAREAADLMGMTATIRNGRVKCDWKKEPTK